MKKKLFALLLFFISIASSYAEIKRIISGNENAKITIIVYESLTCGHCADFHAEVYPLLKKEYFFLFVNIYICCYLLYFCCYFYFCLLKIECKVLIIR